MIKKIKYLLSEQFLFAVIYYDAFPLIHWCDGKGYIYFKTPNKDIHIYYSKNRKLLDAIWNSVGLVRHALKLVSEVK